MSEESDWRLIQDLAMLLRRFIYRLSTYGYSPQNIKLINQAHEFMRKHDLNGTIVRSKTR